MSVLDNMVRAAAREAKRAVRESKYASEHGLTDEWVLDDLKAKAPGFAEALETPIEYERDGQPIAYEPSADIHDDLFLTAHAAGESRVKPREQVKPSHYFGRDVLDTFVRTEDARTAKPMTEGDEISSAIWTRAACQAFDEAMRDEAAREQIEQSEQMQQSEQQLEQAQDAIDELRQQAQEAAANGEPTPDGIADQMREQIAQREQAAAQLGEQIADAKPGVPTAVAQVLKDAAKEAAEKVEVWGQVAGAGAAQFGRVNPDDANRLVEAWMQVPDYRELCKLLGRVVRDFRAEESHNVIGGDDEVIGVTQGADLPLVLPSELGLLGNPLTRKTFYRALVDEALLQFETQGSERTSNGPGVLMLDLSGSMLANAKHTQGKAVCVGYVRLMHKRQRDAVVICFNGSVMWEHHFPIGKSLDMQTLLDLASLAPTGGTNGITAAAERALHYVTKSLPFKKADVLVVTDGQVSYRPEAERVRVAMEKLGVRRTGIAIAHEPSEGGWLLSFCGTAIGVNHLTEATADIVRAVA